MNTLEINKINQGEVFIRINAPIIDDDLANLMRDKLHMLLEKGVNSVTISLENVDEIGSSGIGKLLLFYKRINDIGGKMNVIDVNDRIKRLLQYLRMDMLLA